MDRVWLEKLNNKHELFYDDITENVCFSSIDYMSEVINTSFNEILFYELFQIVGIALLDCEVKEVRCNENKCRIEVLIWK